MSTKTSAKKKPEGETVWPIEAKSPKKAPAKPRRSKKPDPLPPLLQAAAVIAAQVKSLAAEVDKAKSEGAASLGRLYSVARLQYDILGEAMKGIGIQVDYLNRVAIPEAFEAEGIKTLTDAETGDRITITQRMFASIPAEKRDEAYDWLRSNGHASLIVETVNASSLSAFAKSQMEEGIELPEEIFKTTIINQVSLTRGKKGKTK